MFENFGEKINGEAYPIEKNKEDAEAIGNAHNFKELFQTIKQLEEIKGSREKPYDYYELRRDINEAYGAFFLEAGDESFEDPFLRISSGMGLRKKVRELLEAEKIRRSL